MELFWTQDEPLTSVDILTLTTDKTWSGNYLHKMLRELQKKGLVQICGTLQYKTQYARQFKPVLNREEYIAKVFASRQGISRNSVSKVALALVKETIDDEEHKKEVVIKELEQMIEKLRSDAQE